MTDDRALLEAAARAAGMQGRWFGKDFCTLRDETTGLHKPWNPLEDDGDALRLAVKLELHIVPPWHSGGYRRARADHIPSGKQGAWVEDGDPYAATRRSIVRAAAASLSRGERMEG